VHLVTDNHRRCREAKGYPREGDKAMTTHVEAANELATCPRSTGTKMFEDGRASATMIATPRETAAALGAAGWLSLAAAPTCGVMALLTGVLGGGPPDMLCSAARDASPLTGMVPMYLLMGAFHSTPWLKLISRRRSMPKRQV
jgi:hypothetical protein